MNTLKTLTETKRIREKIFRPSILSITILLILFMILPLFIPDGVSLVFSKFWVMALFALSLDLIFGYTGLVSLGHAAFFGAGAYTVALMMRNQITVNFWLLVPSAILASAILAAVLGVIALRTRGTYFMLITLAFTGMVNAAANNWVKITGGSNGLTNIPSPNFGFFNFTASSFSTYYVTLILFAVGYLLIYVITKTAFGKALCGINQNETRMRVSGYNTWLYKYIAFILAGAFAGMAGASFVFYNSFVSPDVANIAQSATGLLMVIIGGPGTLFGAVLGAGIITFLQFYTSSWIATRWPLVMGFVFIAAIMWLRGGIVPYVIKIIERLRMRYGSITSRENS